VLLHVGFVPGAEVSHVRSRSQQICRADASVQIHRYDMASSACRSPAEVARGAAAAVDEDVSNAAFKFMDHRSMEVAHCRPHQPRHLYGDLGYESGWHRKYQRRLYQEIMRRRSARHRELRHARAAFHAARKELPTCSASSAPSMAASRPHDRFIDLTKNDFVGREAAMEEKRDGGKLRRVP